MAYYGLAYPTFAKWNQNGTYSNGFRFGKAVSLDLTINTNKADQYGDNALAEHVEEFRDGAIALGVTAIPIQAYSSIFGHEVTQKAKSVNIVDKTDDLGDFVGVGLIKNEMVDGVRKYIAMWIKKVRFVESGDSGQTKGENIVFNTPTLNGTIMALDNKQWREREIFDTEEEAQAWIDDIAGIKPKCSTPVPSLAAGTYSAAEAEGVTLTAGEAEAIYYTLNGTTPSGANGTLYEEPFDITDTCALKAIAIKEGNSNSDIAVYEYFITA